MEERIDERSSGGKMGFLLLEAALVVAMTPDMLPREADLEVSPKRRVNTSKTDRHREGPRVSRLQGASVLLNGSRDPSEIGNKDLTKFHGGDCGKYSTSLSEDALSIASLEAHATSA